MALLSELIDRLKEIQDSRDDDPEVDVAVQPTYPMRTRIKGVVAPGEAAPFRTEEEIDDDNADAELRVWIVTTGNEDYTAERALWDAAVL